MSLHTSIRTTNWRAPLAALLAALLPALAAAHCDTLDGPVVVDARAALAAADVTPVLKWLPADSEAQLRDLFARVLRVRDLSPEARALAETHFFETLVRLHRESEGAPYEGLKPAGLPPEPAVVLAEAALASDSPDALLQTISTHLREALQPRWAAARAARAAAGTSPELGRAWVAAYVDFVHYVKRLLTTLQHGAGKDHAAHTSALSAPSCGHHE